MAVEDPNVNVNDVCMSPTDEIPDDDTVCCDVNNTADDISTEGGCMTCVPGDNNSCHEENSEFERI